MAHDVAMLAQANPAIVLEDPVQHRLISVAPAGHYRTSFVAEEPHSSHIHISTSGSIRQGSAVGYFKVG